VKGLAEFSGVGRRFQRYGDVAIAGGGHFTLIDDYGHHPAEMAATLAAARGAFPGRRILLAFQPHRYTRTRDLFEDFVRVLSSADELVLADVYSAGEAPIVAADGRSLARAVRVAGKVEPVFVEGPGQMREAVLGRVKDGDVVITMGAGSIGFLAAELSVPPPPRRGQLTRRAGVEMDMSDAIKAGRLRGTHRQDEPMAKHVSWRAGGRARLFYQPADVADLCEFLRTLGGSTPILFVGLGSNLLVRDGGFNGAVVFTHHALTGIEERGELTFRAAAGVPAPHLARFVAKHGGAGAEWMAGVPGTIGGALAMNAGCYGGETWSHVASVETVDRRGELHERGRISSRWATATCATRRTVKSGSSRQRSISTRATRRRRWRACASSSRSGSPRNPSASRTPGASSAIRRRTTRRGSSSPAASRDSRWAARRCRRSTPTSS
jgi:hypothetical protein